MQTRFTLVVSDSVTSI